MGAERDAGGARAMRRAVRGMMRRRLGARLALAAALMALVALVAPAVAAGAKPFDPNAPKKPQEQPGAPKPTGGPAAPRLSRRVVVVSLDGAAAETLQQLWRDDQLDEGGFARFFREGQVAASLVPVNPTLTAPNHVSLATGAAPDHTGIVGNRFHAAGTPLFEQAKGTDFPIGAETLWEAVRRQKKQAAVLAWPGADGTTPRRRADLGMNWVGVPDREPRLLALKRSDWLPAAAPPKLSSHSPMVAAHIALAGTGGAQAAAFDFFAVDRTDDGRVDYDAVVVAVATAPVGAAGAASSSAIAELRQSEPLAQGQWAEVSFPDRGGRSIGWFKVVALDSGLDAVRVYFSGSYRLDAYPPDFAKDLAETNLAWPGAPDDRRLVAGWNGQPGIDLQTWTEQADRFAAFFGGAMRVAAAREGWNLLLAYMPVIDEAGHVLLLADPHQEGYSAARRDELARARLKVWQAVDRELRLLLASLDLGRTTVVVVSDHGMAPVHTAIDLNALLGERGLLARPAGGPQGSPPAPGAAAAGVKAYVIGDAGMAHLYLVEPAGADPAVRQRLLADLRDQLLAWRIGDDTPLERVVTRQEAAELGLDHPNSGDLLLFAREGYAFDPGPEPAGTVTTHPASVYGAHGYLAANSNMQGIYLAIGKDIKPATTSGPVQAIDVAGRVAAWLGIEKPRPGGR